MVRFLAVVLGWLLFPSVLPAVCDFRPVFSGQFRVTALDVEIDDSDLWLATSYGIELYNRTVDPPQLIASLALPGMTTAVAPAGRFTYVGSGSSLYVITRGNGLQTLYSLDLGAAIHDLYLASRFIYAATRDGVVQVDLLVPEQPVIATRLTTTTGAAFSLAQLGSHLYAADGDGSLEVFTLQIPDLPQKIGTVASLPRTLSVHSSGTLLYTSDGQQSEVFTGSGASLSRLDSIPSIATLAFHLSAGELFFGSGLDRKIRAFDRSSKTILFDVLLPVTPGNVNRVQALAAIGDRLYAAAGDLGLVTYDLARFRAPYLMRAYPLGRAKSVIESGASVYASFDAGGIRQFARQQNGVLTQRLQWDGSRISVLHEATEASLLSSSGNSLTLWDLAGSAPSASSTATFSTTIRGAIVRERMATVLLADGSLWKADLSQPAPAPTPVFVSGARPAFIARAGSAIALADLEENGTTTIRYFSAGDLATAPQSASIEGAATSGVALSASGIVSAATFRGVTLVDFSAGAAIALLPQTNFATRDLHISGDDLYVLTSARLQIWSISSHTLKREIDLPAEALSLYRAEDEVTIATTDGLTTINPTTASEQPEQISSPAANAYHRKVVAGGNHVYLFDGRNVDVYLAPPSGVTSFQKRISFPGVLVDIAADNERLFALSSAGKVLVVRSDGTIEAEYQISEGEGVQPLAIRAVSGALYVSVSKGCPGACEKRTLVLDHRNGIVQTSSFPGALRDVVIEQNTAYGLFDLPEETRILNLTDPYHPTITASRPSEGDPVSIAYSSAQQAIYTLGQKLYAYSGSSLSKIGEQLSSYSDPSGSLSYFDQTARLVAPDCAIIAGRSLNPALQRIVSANTWQPATTPPVPSSVRSIAIRDGMLFLLCDHSVEVWSSRPAPARLRSIRH